MRGRGPGPGALRERESGKLEGQTFPGVFRGTLRWNNNNNNNKGFRVPNIINPPPPPAFSSSHNQRPNGTSKVRGNIKGEDIYSVGVSAPHPTTVAIIRHARSFPTTPR